MAVIQAPQSGGGWNPLGILSTLAMLFPGGQAIAPWLAGAGALTSTLRGHPEEAVKYGAGLLGKGMGGTESVFNEAPIEPTIGMSDVRKYLSDNNPMAQPLDAPAVDITANQRMLNGTEAILPWSDADETKYQGLLGQYGLGGKQAMGENADMGTRYVDNIQGKNYGNRYNELLSQYNLSDMDWTGRKKRRWK